jgi:hypothetical protein
MQYMYRLTMLRKTFFLIYFNFINLKYFFTSRTCCRLFLYPVHDRTSPSWCHDGSALQPKLNPKPLTSQRSTLTPSYLPLAKLQAPQACIHTHVSKVFTFPSSIFDTTNGGSKGNILSWNSYGRCKDTICTCGKVSYFFSLKNNLCANSKVALIVCVWLIFKLGFDLDDDLYWIQALLMK